MEFFGPKIFKNKYLESQHQHKLHDHSTHMLASEDLHIYESNLFGKGQYRVASKKAPKKSCTCTAKACDNCYTTCERKLSQSENSESIIYGHCLPPFAVGDDDATCTCTTATDGESVSRNYQNHSTTAIYYRSIPEHAEQKTSAVRIGVSSCDEDQIYENVCPQDKVKLATQPGEENEPCRHKEQNLHLNQKREATEMSLANIKPVPNESGQTPCNEINEFQEPMKEPMEQNHHQRCTDVVTEKDKATGVSATKPVPQPRPRLRKSCQEIPESEEPLKEYMEKKQQRRTDDLTENDKAIGVSSTNIKPVPQPQPRLRKSCQEIPETKEHLKETREQEQQERTDDFTQKDKTTMMPTTKMEPQTKIKPERQTSCQEIPEIEEHLEEFREQLKQLMHGGCSDITSMVVSNLNFTGCMMDKKGGRLQLKSHGVMLYVPPGALGDEPQEIFIYVQRNFLSSHHTVKDGFVSPIVHCGTSGLKFKIPVILTFPVNFKSSSPSKLAGVRQDSSTKPWAEISDCSSEVVLFHDGLCTVISDHFTGYGACEQSNDPPVSGVKLRVGVFIPQHGAIDPVHGCLQLRVRIWDESSETNKHIKDAEENSMAMDTQRRLFLNTAEGPNNHVFVEIQTLNEQWSISDTPRRQVLPLKRFRMDPHVDESCTFNLKPNPQNVAGNDNLRQLECNVRVSQRSDQLSAVVIRPVHEIEIRPVHRNQQDRLNMQVAEADDSHPMPPQIYGELLWFYEERQRRIDRGELNNPVQCSDDDRQDQAGQLQASSLPPQPNHPTGEDYGHQVQQRDGLKVRNDQLLSQSQASQGRHGSTQPNQQAQQTQNVAGNNEIGGIVEHLSMDSNDPSVNSRSQPNQTADKPKNVLKRVKKIITNNFKRSSQSSKENDSTDFDVCLMIFLNWQMMECHLSSGRVICK